MIRLAQAGIGNDFRSFLSSLAGISSSREQEHAEGAEEAVSQEELTALADDANDDVVPLVDLAMDPHPIALPAATDQTTFVRVSVKRGQAWSKSESGRPLLLSVL